MFSMKFLDHVQRVLCGRTALMASYFKMFSEACVSHSVGGGRVGDRDPRYWHIVATTAAVRKHPTRMHSCFSVKFYRPQTKFAKVMFSQVSVCPQGGVSQHVMGTGGGIPACSGQGWCLPGGSLPGGVYPGGATRGRVSGVLPQTRGRYYGIRSTSRRYASQWNAFLWNGLSTVYWQKFLASPDRCVAL